MRAPVNRLDVLTKEILEGSLPLLTGGQTKTSHSLAYSYGSFMVL